MITYLKKIGLVLSLIVCHSMFAESGLLFDVSATGTPAPDKPMITLCLNGKASISCQNYTVPALSLKILAVPNHFYPNAGIKINTAAYKIGNLGIDCVPQANQYCLFSVSNAIPKSISLVFNGPLLISPSLLSNAMLSTLYNQIITAKGGIEPYTYTIIDGQLPPGLSLNSTNGAISGTPTNSGTYNFTVMASDSDTPNSNTGSKAYSLVVSGSLTLNPSSLPTGQLSTSYNAVITASGGVGPYTFTVSAGSLPPGLTLNPNGTLSGTPTSIGTYPFTITATDTNTSDTGSKAYSVVVSGSLTLSPSSLPSVQEGTAYSETITASGGVGPYDFTVSAGSLPPGLTLNLNGALSGTLSTAGTYPFTVTATDTNSNDTGSEPYSIVVNSAVICTKTITTNLSVSNPYSQSITINYSMVGGGGGAGNQTNGAGGGGGSSVILADSIAIAVANGGNGGNSSSSGANGNLVIGSFSLSVNANLGAYVGGGGGGGSSNMFTGGGGASGYYGGGGGGINNGGAGGTTTGGIGGDNGAQNGSSQNGGQGGPSNFGGGFGGSSNTEVPEVMAPIRAAVVAVVLGVVVESVVTTERIKQPLVEVLDQQLLALVRLQEV